MGVDIALHNAIVTDRLVLLGGLDGHSKKFNRHAYMLNDCYHIKDRGNVVTFSPGNLLMQFNVNTCNGYKILGFKKELLEIKGDTSLV